MPELEQRLAELAADAQWPPTPDLATAVVTRLGQGPAVRERRSARRRRSRRLLAAVLAAVVALPAVAFAVPDSRHAILDALGLRHLRVERRAVPPPAAAVVDPRLGLRTTLADAARRAGFAPARATALGAPEAVFVRDGVITLSYRGGRLRLAQADGRFDGIMLRKVVGADAALTATTVGGAPALFFGAPHALRWSDATGPLERSAPALVWERDGRVLRLEGEPSLAQARRIAESVS